MANPRFCTMSEDYDVFSYPDDEDAFYEPVLDPSLPPVPPRSTRFPPRQLTPPSLVIGQEPDSNYEDLNDIKQRAPPALPDVSTRTPLAPPDVGVDPELNYEDLNTPDLNYEDLNDFEEKRPILPTPPILPERLLPPVPDTSSKKNVRSDPPIGFEEDTKRHLSDACSSSQVSPNILNTIRKNLKKTESNSLKESPKSQLPPRSEVVAKPQIAEKPTLPPKPFKAAKISSNIAEKLNALNLDSNDGKQVSPNVKMAPLRTELTKMETVSPSAKKNTVSPSAKMSPLRTEITQMNTEENLKEEELDSIGEYMDAAEIKSLHSQPYYYEVFSKAQEHNLFTKDTEDGTFVIRKSRPGSSHPYTILVYYDSRAFRLKIRYENEQYAIGEWKADEIKFPSVVDLVEHYQNTPLMLIGAGSTRLTNTPRLL